MAKVVLVFITLIAGRYATCIETPSAPQTKLALSDNPDEIGTACANDPSNLWLDIIVAIDNTSSMGSGVNNVANHLK
uniref:VWFA domain-containing protein n=1 Tax=Acrobeloides nanus TaxID=290746 RepID=A0A914D9U9_9BILA